VHIGGGAFIRAEGGLYIGSNVHISRDVTVYTINHEYEGEALPYDDAYRARPVRIGDNVWVGTRVFILPGTVIGEGAIIGGGAVVTGTIPPGTVIGAPVGQEIGKRDMDHYRELAENKCFGGADGVKIG
jgi:acetyltransferase-like isoleucine patch superfamily enzyme